MKHCSACGKDCEDSRSYCPRCGAALTPPEEKTAPEKPKLPSKVRRWLIPAATGLLVVLALALGLLLRARTARFTSPEALAREYVALFTADKEEKLRSLFPEELTRRADMEELDRFSISYGVPLELIGVYDVTDSSELDVSAVNRALRNDYGMEPLAEDYVRLLTGAVVNGTDIWFQMDVIRIGRGWYFYRIS